MAPCQQRQTYRCSPSLRHGDPDLQMRASAGGSSSIHSSGISDVSLAPRPLLRQPPGPYLLLQPHQTYAHGCARAHTLTHTQTHTQRASHPQTQLPLSRSLCSLARGSLPHSLASRSRSSVLPGLTPPPTLVGQLPGVRP